MTSHPIYPLAGGVYIEHPDGRLERIDEHASRGGPLDETDQGAFAPVPPPKPPRPRRAAAAIPDPVDTADQE